MIIGNKNFDTEKHCYIMGILNVTPDSFSDGGKYNDMDAALKHAEEMIDEGADIIDVGGESTRPGHEKISDEEEICRTAAVIERIKQEFDIPVSIDTYKSRVAEAALKSGADLVNDIWGFKYDDKIAEVTARYGAACCLMHNRDSNLYDDFLDVYKRQVISWIRIKSVKKKNNGILKYTEYLRNIVDIYNRREHEYKNQINAVISIAENSRKEDVAGKIMGYCHVILENEREKNRLSVISDNTMIEMCIRDR